MSAKVTRFEREGIKTQAEIVRIEREYDANYKEEISVYVKYTVDNTTYTRELNYYASNFHEGDSITILYLPNNPASISYAKAQAVSPILFYVGAGICFAFAIFISITSITDNKLTRLKESGKMVTAVIKKFNCNKCIRVLGKYPATLICEDAFGNTYKRIFLCEYGCSFHIGDTIMVYIDNTNTKNYIIDVVHT